MVSCSFSSFVVVGGGGSAVFSFEIDNRTYCDCDCLVIDRAGFYLKCTAVVAVIGFNC